MKEMNDLIKIKKDSDSSYGLLAKTIVSGKDIVTLRMVCNADIPSILRPVSCSIGDEYSFSWYITDCIPVSELTKKADENTLNSMCRGLIRACLSVKEYMLAPSSLILDPNCVFFFHKTGETKFLCLPGAAAMLDKHIQETLVSGDKRVSEMTMRYEKSLQERTAEFIAVIAKSDPEHKTVADALQALLCRGDPDYSQLLEFIERRLCQGFCAMIENRRTGQLFEISSSEAVIGRSSGSGCLCVSDRPAVSRAHASIEFENGEWRIRDMNASNGTMVNGTSIGGGGTSPLSCGSHFMLANEPFVFYC